MSDVDCLIIGGGPAGLTAAIYAARFHLSVLILDAGASRAGMIPRTRNHAGFPDGISGPDLLGRMRKQALRFGVAILPSQVDKLQLRDRIFAAQGEFPEVLANAVILATGVTNRRPVMSETLHDEALDRGNLRYCPVCDAYEVTDQNVAVIGTGTHGAREAVFLRSYTDRVSLIAPDGLHDLQNSDREELTALGIITIDGPARRFELMGDGIRLEHACGTQTFDTVYPALGSVIHSGLAQQLGAELTDMGCIRVDAHQRTTVPGLYAAGDVVIGLDQISHAMGEAGVAATTLRNDLAQNSPIRR